MSRVMESYINEYNKRQTRKRKLVISLVCLSLVVFFTVVELLKVQGISLAGVAQDASVAVNKTIDNLGDENPDTDLTGTDFYRLYLTAEGVPASNAVDLLIVIDQSGTMFENNDISYNGSNQYRDCVIGDILNGSAYVSGRQKPNSQNYDRYADNVAVHCTATDRGLINQFLGVDPRNKVAVIGFNADRRFNYDGNQYPARVNQGYSYQSDSDILLDWTGNKITGNGVNTTAYCYTGTNYHAALLRASDMFNSPAIANDGNVKVMIFFSDGVPTCYISDYGTGDRSGTTMSGTSSNPETNNISNCRQPSLDAFNTFINNHPDVICYSVGISDELAETGADARADNVPPFSDFVLKQYVHQVDGKGYYYSGKNGDKLREDMMELIMNNAVQNLVITDKLSQYVQYYSDNADVKVTMTDTNGNETILYSDGITDAGQGIIRSVNYTPVADNEDKTTTTGTIEAIFEPDYGLRSGYQYTLSYNVVLTEEAYNTYTTSGYGTTVGDSNTDFGSNASSSGQGGLYSNKEAYVEYTVGNTQYTAEDPKNVFDHPVVQISTKDIIVNKIWLNSDDSFDNSPHGNVTVQLYRESIPLGEDPTTTPSGSSQDPDGWKHADSFVVGQAYVLKNADTGEIVQCADYSAEYHSLQYLSGVDLSGSIPDDCIWIFNSNGTLEDINGNPVFITGWSHNGGDNRQVWCGTDSNYTDSTITYDNGKIKVSNSSDTFYLTNEYNSADTYEDGNYYILYPVSGSSGYTSSNGFAAGHTYLIMDNSTELFIQPKPSNAEYHSLDYEASVDMSGAVSDSCKWTYNQNQTLTDSNGNSIYITSWSDGEGSQIWCGSDSGFTDCTVQYSNGKIQIKNNRTTVYLNGNDHGSSNSEGGHDYTLYEYASSYRLITEPIPTPTEAPQGNEEPGVTVGDPVSFSGSYTFEDLYVQGNADGKIYQYRYYVKETTVPTGYHVSYSVSDSGALVVTNKSDTTVPPSPTPTENPGSEPTPSETPTPSEDPTPTSEPTDTPTPTPTSTPTPSPTPVPSPEPGKVNLEINKIWKNADGTEDTATHEAVSIQLYRELTAVTPEPVPEPTAEPTPSSPWITADEFEVNQSYVLMEEGTGKIIQEKPYSGEYHSFLYPTDIDLDGNIPENCVFTYKSDGTLVDVNGNAFYITSWSSNGSGQNVNKQVWCGSDDSFTATVVDYVDGRIKVSNSNTTFYLTGEDQASDTLEGGSHYILYPVTGCGVSNKWVAADSFEVGHTYVLWNEDSNVAAAKDLSGGQYQSVIYTTDGLDLSNNIVPDNYKWTYDSNKYLTNGSGNKAFVPTWCNDNTNYQLWCGTDSNGQENGYSNTTVAYENGKLHFANSSKPPINCFLTDSSSGAKRAEQGDNYTLYELQSCNTYTATARPSPTQVPSPTPSVTPQYDGVSEEVGDVIEFYSSYTFVNLDPQGERDNWTYTYRYYVEEVQVQEGYLVSYKDGNDGSINVINSKDPSYVPPPTPTPTPGPINITVKKVWKDDGGEIAPIEPVTVQLYRNAVNASAEVGNIHISDIEYGEPFELSTVNDCEYIIRDLPVFGNIGGIDVNFSYYAVEVNSGEVLYEVSYSHDTDNAVSEDGTTITITNKLTGVYGYELPNTGGTGIHGHFIIGSLVTTSTTLLLIFTRKRRGRGEVSDSG